MSQLVEHAKRSVLQSTVQRYKGPDSEFKLDYSVLCCTTGGEPAEAIALSDFLQMGDEFDGQDDHGDASDSQDEDHSQPGGNANGCRR